MEILKDFEKYLMENYDTEGDKNTIQSYLSDIKQFLNFFKEKFDEDIIVFSRGHFIEYKNYMLKEKGYRFTTINRKTAALSVYENFLLDRKRKNTPKIIKKKDFYKIDLGLVTSDMLPKNTIKKVRLKSGQNTRDYLIFIILDEGGLRVSELVNIQLERDVNISMRKMIIFGKGKKVREIFINDTMLDAIEEYLPDREKLLNGRENKYLLVSNKTAGSNKPMGRTSINNILAKYCEEVREDKINPHLFRHHCATTRYEEGYTEMMLKKMLGQNSNVTLRYVHEGGEEIRKNRS